MNATDVTFVFWIGFFCGIGATILNMRVWRKK